MTKKMMKKMRKNLLALSMMCAMALSLVSIGTVTHAEEEYGYTVRFLTAKQGTFASNPSGLELKDLAYGDQVNVSVSDSGAVSITVIGEGGTSSYGEQINFVDGEKYYSKGIRISGRDNNTVSPSFKVTEDRDYVVAYGIKGDMVAYTVNYVDQNNASLGESQTYYGNVGEQVIVPYLYVDGYQPQAYNYALTLKSNAADNVINIRYTPVPTTTTTTTTTPSTTPTTPTTPSTTAGTTTGTTGGTTAGTTGGTTAGTTGGTTAGTTGGTTDATGGAADANAGGTTAANGAVGAPDATDDTSTIADENTPQDLIDLDEGEDGVAKGNVDLGQDESASDSAAVRTHSKTPIIIGIVVAAVAVVGICGTMFYLKKKRGQ